MYQQFKAKASQQGELNIGLVIHQNEPGLSQFTRESAGQYRSTLPAGATLEQDNFLYLITNGQTAGRVTAYVDDSTIVVASYNASGELSDGIIDNATLSFELLLS